MNLLNEIPSNVLSVPDQIVQMLCFLLNGYQRENVTFVLKHKNEDIQTMTFVFFHRGDVHQLQFPVDAEVWLYCGSRA